MVFKIRDLLIQALPSAEGGACAPGSQALGCGSCTSCTWGGCTCTASYQPPPDVFRQPGWNQGPSCGSCTSCTWGGCTCTASYQPPPENSLEALAVLKAALKDSLAKVERQENALLEELSPQTVEEVDKLEAKLKKAIVELGNRRTELLKQNPPENS